MKALITDASSLLRGYTIKGMSDHIRSFYFTFAQESDVIYFSLPVGGLLLAVRHIHEPVRKRFLISALTVIIGLILAFGALRVVGWIPSDTQAVLLFYFFEYPTLLMGWLMFVYIIALGAVIGEISLKCVPFRRKPLLGSKKIVFGD